MVTIADTKGRSETENLNDVLFEIKRFVGSKIAVVWTTCPLKRDGFHTAMSVSGELEAREENGEWAFRVLVDDGNYTYFKIDNIDGLVIKQTQLDEQAVIYIR